MYGNSLEHYAVLEWHYIKQFFNKKDLTSSTGALECFCKDLSAYDAFNKIYSATEENSDVIVRGKVCYDWEMGIML